MLEINMNPRGINWDKEDTVLMTPAGVAHTCKGEILKLGVCWTRDKIIAAATKPLSDHFIILHQSYNVYGYDVNVVNKPDDSQSYISIIGKHFDDARQIDEYEKAYGLKPITEEDIKYGHKFDHKLRDINQPYSYCDSEHPEVNIHSEIRVYKDKSVNVLFRATYADGHIRYFVFKANYYTSNNWYLVNSNVSKEEEWFANPEVVEIFSEDEVRKTAIKNTLKYSIITKAIGHNECGLDLGEGYSMGCDNYHTFTFSKKTQNAIDDFMGTFTEDEKLCKEVFDKKYRYVNGSVSRSVDSGIISPIYLDKWTTCRASTALADKKKAADLDALWPTIHWGPTSAKEQRTICWERRTDENGDFVIAAYKDDRSHHWGPNKIAFLYDVKKRTRKVVVTYDSGSKAKPQTLIPSLQQCILKYFDFAPSKEYDYKRGDYIMLDDGPIQYIHGGITIKELFAGTNIAWILENEKEFGDDMFYLFKDDPGHWGDNQIRKLQDDVKEGGTIGVVALCILATTGNAMLEQLLKSRMFRMYFLALANEADGQHIFWDTSKKVATRYDECPFPYTSKGKNLKDMFGMSLTQLRIADKAIEIVKEKRSTYSGEETVFSYQYPRYGDVAKVLGIERLSALNDEFFNELTEMTKHEATRNSYYNSWGRGIFNDIAMKQDILDYFAHNTAKERFNIIKGFHNTDEVDKFADYLRMRANMIELQKARPTEDIFDNKTYPNRVGRAVKFIRFMPGMKGDSGWYGGSYCDGDIDTQEQFIELIKRKYAAYATEKGSVQLELNEDGHVAGAIVKMNQLQHMNFLHDEMSQWYAMYNDDSKVEEFKAATKRVNKYVWSDDGDTGLCIVGPKDPADLRKEGSVLSHCVASYVNPIIAGSHNIMFIRRVDMVDEPYYTLDINEAGEVTEVHGYRNCNMEDSDVDAAYAETGREVYSKHFDIKKFLQNWAKAMKGKVKEKSLRSTYSKLDIIA